MLHKDKQEYHEHLFSGVSGLFLSWSVVLSLNMFIGFITHGIFLPTCSDTLPPIPFHAQGTRFTGRL